MPKGRTRGGLSAFRFAPFPLALAPDEPDPGEFLRSGQEGLRDMEIIAKIYSSGDPGFAGKSRWGSRFLEQTHDGS